MYWDTKYIDILRIFPNEDSFFSMKNARAINIEETTMCGQR